MKPAEVVQLMEALAVTAEVCGADISPAAAKIMAAELAGEPFNAVITALVKLRREHSGRLTLAAIMSRIDDGRPTADEAWVMIPKSEEHTAVITQDTMNAMCVSDPLREDGDVVGAHIAFKDAYKKSVSDAKIAGTPVKWIITIGWDKSMRAGIVAEAVKLGRITEEKAMACLPEGTYEGDQLASILRMDARELENKSQAAQIQDLSKNTLKTV